jgi:hypothetical protein
MNHVLKFKPSYYKHAVATFQLAINGNLLPKLLEDALSHWQRDKLHMWFLESGSLLIVPATLSRF